MQTWAAFHTPSIRPMFVPPPSPAYQAGTATPLAGYWVLAAQREQALVKVQIHQRLYAS